ncbi:hypothetical protein ASF31_00265 [Brevundimonas sp. Leaf280]|uniref:DUF6624 domain-containing protein n=1 Tax=Brevundimonas sp. Leaf280 TaxID=1736320 RepID=UPI0006FDF692|nr:DUF6624 domain-containing protein [Brevundimonas sp. Leaf280]KQP47828.1 hypothetical protein ASF31_00265 [Brevundimonas sp. Leaf280]
MRPSRLSCAAAVSAVALAFAVPVLAQDAPPPNNAEMAAIFAADQAVRQTLTPDFFKDRARVTEMLAADAERRVQTRALLDAGALQTGEDYRAAAFVFQHGSTPEDYLLAHSLAVAAVAKGSPEGAWIAAATLDRYLQMTEKPQIYGTQTRKIRDAPATLDPYDRALIPDSLRAVFGVPPQSEQDARLAAVNAAAEAAASKP